MNISPQDRAIEIAENQQYAPFIYQIDVADPFSHALFQWLHDSDIEFQWLAKLPGRTGFLFSERDKAVMFSLRYAIRLHLR
jgi:hypothetical protein